MRRVPWTVLGQPQTWATVIGIGLVVAGWAVPVSDTDTRRTSVLGVYSRIPARLAVSQLGEQHVDCAVQACLALTFDDGPDRDYTPAVLNALKRHNARATFFVLGPHAERHPALLWREFREGHEIGNHSWSHADFRKLSPEQMKDEIGRTERAVTAVGLAAPTLFRPPYGGVNDAVKRNVPLSIVRWNVDSEDWKAKDVASLVQHTVAQAKPGGIVVLHDTEQMTVEAIEPLLQQLTGSYRLVTVSELLNLSPGQPGVFYGR